MRRIPKLTMLIMIIIVTLLSACAAQDTKVNPYFVPHLPRPLAHERAVITSAGQGAEGLVISKIASQLNIKNRFWRKVRGKDLSDRYDGLIIVLGLSYQNMERLKTNTAEEKKRLAALAKGAKELGIAVVMINAGKLYRHSETDIMAQLLAPYTDYIIVVGEGNYDGLFSQLAFQEDIPITIVKDLQKIKTPLNSVFR